MSFGDSTIAASKYTYKISIIYFLLYWNITRNFFFMSETKVWCVRLYISRYLSILAFLKSYSYNFYIFLNVKHEWNLESHEIH